MKSNIIGLSILLIATLTYAFDKTISVLDFELTDTTIKMVLSNPEWVTPLK